jgi:hypothetical protein
MMHEIETFKKRLAETIAYCALWEKGTDTLVDQFRSASLRPPEFTGDPCMSEHTHNQIPYIIDNLIEKREDLLQIQQIVLPQLKLPLAGGRILAFDPDESTCDGASMFATQGFLDDDNVPPWDTWIYYVMNGPKAVPSQYHSYLLSWVPNSLVPIVSKGISTNSEECLCWATDLDTAFIQQLRQAGLLR